MPLLLRLCDMALMFCTAQYTAMRSTCSLTITSRHIYSTVNDIQGHSTETFISKYAPTKHIVSR